MMVWVFARLVRAFDCLISLNSNWDKIIASSTYGSHPFAP
jgi:hypothetical protein